MAGQRWAAGTTPHLFDDLVGVLPGEPGAVGQPDVVGVEVDVGADRRVGGDGWRGALGHGASPRSRVGMTWMTSSQAWPPSGGCTSRAMISSSRSRSSGPM
jgi:hypothetical protein